MNTSFRTAFWAMCLGLTVPMVLFIGVEMTSGKRAAQNSKVTASNHRGSLRSYWEKSASKSGRRDSPPSLARGSSGSTAGTAPASSQASVAIASQSRRQQPASPAPSPESRDAGVTLDRQLESDPAAAASVAGRDRRIPAVATGQRPSVEILPDPNGMSHDAQAIQERLDSIQQQLDRLAQSIAAQAPREPQPDPVQQTIELLRQLRQARDLEEPVAPRAGSTLPETDDKKPAIKPDDKAAGDKPEIKARQPAEAGSVRKAPASGPEGAAKKPRPVTKIYRPRHVSATVLRAAIEPMLTDKIGKVGAADATPGDLDATSAGDSTPAAVSALVVRDFPEVLRKIDRLVFDLDVPALPVVIEATAITVRLSGATPNGIDLQGFNGTGQSFAVTPVEGALSAPSSAGGTSSGSYSSGHVPMTDGPVLTHGLGLKCGILRGDPRAFLGVLRTVTQAQRVDAWQLNALDRQTAQLMVNDRFGPEGTVMQTSAGMILKIRPTVCEGGLVRLDVEREVGLNSAVSASRAAALTSQFSLLEGETAVAGGFFADHLAAHTYRTPGIGQVPLVGRMFSETATVRERAETIVLLTPHVVRPPPAEGVALRKARPKSKPVGRPVLRETAEKRGAGRPVLTPTAEARGAGGPVPKETAEKRGAARSALKTTAEEFGAGRLVPKETAERRADTGRTPVRQAAVSGTKQTAEAAMRRAESPRAAGPGPAPAPVLRTRPAEPYSPRRLPLSEEATARPIDDARPAGKAAKPKGDATDDSLEAIPELTMPPEIEPQPVVRHAGGASPR
jgi:type II secretory pathway component GspD/PulD (secretin)